MITFSELGRWGRLGNQMYEYAALLGIGFELGYEVAIPPLDQHLLGSCFDISAPILTRRDRRRIRHHFHEPRIGWSERYRGIEDFTDLTGFFQSERYFPPREVVKAEFTFHPALLEVAASIVEPWRGAGRPVVGVTVRRGDYQLNPQQFVQLWSTDFYDRAVSVIDEQVTPDAVFLVSSDEPEWCRERFADERFVVLDDAPDEAQLALLTMCDHLIIANSSFAWWGAWLNDAPGLRLASDTWWGEHGDAPEADRDPLPDGWIALPVGVAQSAPSRD